jgi:hypothetical protein
MPTATYSSQLMLFFIPTLLTTACFEQGQTDAVPVRQAATNTLEPGGILCPSPFSAHRRWARSAVPVNEYRRRFPTVPDSRRNASTRPSGSTREPCPRPLRRPTTSPAGPSARALSYPGLRGGRGAVPDTLPKRTSVTDFINHVGAPHMPRGRDVTSRRMSFICRH